MLRFILAALAGAVLLGQEGRQEVFGAAGIGKTYDDEGSVGSGLIASAGYGYRFTNRLSAELDFTHIRHKRELSTLMFRGYVNGFTGNILYHFSTSRVQPYLVGGAGVSQHTNTSRQLLFPGIGDRNSTGLTWNGGFGVKAFLNESLYLRPEVRLRVTNGSTIFGVEPPLTTIGVSMGVGYRW